MHVGIETEDKINGTDDKDIGGNGNDTGTDQELS
jgi:hypothetical protein